MSTSLRKIKTDNTKINLKKILRNKKKQIRLYFLLSGTLLITLGFLLSKPPSFSTFKTNPISENVTDEVVSFSQEPITIDEALLKVKNQKKLQKDSPIRIVIPDLDVDLPIKEAKIEKGFWQVFPDAAGFGVGSAYPEEVGNQVIFAHAREGLFLPLKNVKIGQVVYILTKEKWYQYRVEETKEVLPSKLEVIAPTTDSTLTLYTCSGFSDSKRLIVVAKKI